MKKLSFIKAVAILYFLTVYALTSFSQTVYDISGTNWKEKKYVEVNGSPFLSDKWGKGIISLGGNRTVNGLELKLDLIDGSILYKNAAGQIMELAEPVAEFKIEYGEKERLFRSGYKLARDNTKNPYLEVLSDGNVKFLKRTAKVIFEEKDYSGKTSKNINEKISYYIVKDGVNAIPVNRDIKSIATAIGDKEEELKTFVKANNLNLKEDADILKLFEYYHNISKKA